MFWIPLIKLLKIVYFIILCVKWNKKQDVRLQNRTSNVQTWESSDEFKIALLVFFISRNRPWVYVSFQTSFISVINYTFQPNVNKSIEKCGSLSRPVLASSERGGALWFRILKFQYSFYIQSWNLYDIFNLGSK